MEVSASEPSKAEKLAYLQEKQDSHYFNHHKYGHDFSGTTMVCVVCPTGGGKSTLVREVSKRHGVAQLQSSMTRAMEPRDRHELHHRFSVPLDEFYYGAIDESIVNFFVNRNNEVYGTFPSGFTEPMTIGAIGYETFEQLTMCIKSYDMKVFRHSHSRKLNDTWTRCSKSAKGILAVLQYNKTHGPLVLEKADHPRTIVSKYRLE